MSKSLARKKSDKKTKGSFKNLRTKRHDYKRERQAQPPFPQSERTVPSVLVRGKVVTIARFEDTGWNRSADPGKKQDVRTITAVLTDGTRISKDAVISYGHNEREKILEAATMPVSDEKSSWALKSIVDIKLRRAALVQKIYGQLQSEYR